MADFCPIRKVDHLELYVGNAKQAAAFYGAAFGFATTAYRGLETKYREAASYVLEQGDVRLVLTTALNSSHPIAKHVCEHGDGVGVIALSVPDAAAAFHETTRRGAVPGDRADRGTGRARDAPLSPPFTPTATPLIKFIDRDDYAGRVRPGFPAPNQHARRQASRSASPRSITSSATSSSAAWTDGCTFSPTRWDSRSSCTSTTRRSPPSTPR